MITGDMLDALKLTKAGHGKQVFEKLGIGGICHTSYLTRRRIENESLINQMTNTLLCKFHDGANKAHFFIPGATLIEAAKRGGDHPLRFGDTRAKVATKTWYDISYRSATLRIIHSTEIVPLDTKVNAPSCFFPASIQVGASIFRDICRMLDTGVVKVTLSPYRIEFRQTGWKVSLNRFIESY